MKFCCFLIPLLICLAVRAKAQSAQAFCPNIPPVVRYLHVISKIEMRFATTHVISYVTNVANVSQEIIFRTKLPKKAYITGFVMEVNGLFVAGTVKEKKIALAEYQDATGKGLSAGHIATQASKPAEFKVSVNIGARSKVRFNLTYQELLEREEECYKHALSINPDYIAEKVRVDIIIADRERLRYLHVVNGDEKLSEESNSAIRLMDEAFYDDVQVRRSSRRGVQLLSHIILYDTTGMIVTLYDLARKPNAGQIETAGGYFVHFFSADNIQPGKRHIAFVLDKSGSMGWGNDRVTKMDQLREAMRVILGSLKTTDKFSLVMFDGEVKEFQPNQMIDGNAPNLQRAADYIYKENPSGGTNIEGSLERGLQLLNGAGTSFYSLLFFLTDGDATVGQRNTTALLNKVKALNTRKHKIFPLSFGNDANYGFLQQLAEQNGGFARRIFLDGYASMQIEGYFKKVSQLVMKNVNVSYVENSVDVNTIATNMFVNEFHKGDEFIFLGKIKLNDIISKKQPLSATVNGLGPAGTISRTAHSPRIPWNSTLLCSSSQRHELFLGGVTCRSLGGGRRRITATRAPDGATFSVNTPAGFLERMYAYQTVKLQLHKAKHEAKSPAEAQLFLDQALTVSLKYQFVTELTSMIVVAPEVKNMTMAFPQDAWPVVDSWLGTEDIFGAAGRGSTIGSAILATPSPQYLGFYQDSNAYLESLDAEELMDEFKLVPVNSYDKVKWSAWFLRLLPALNDLNNPTQIKMLPWSDIWVHIDNTTAAGLCWQLLKDIPLEAWEVVPLSVVQNLYPYALSSLPVETLRTIPLDHLKSLDPKRYSAFTTDVLSAIDTELLQHALTQVTGWIDP